MTTLRPTPEPYPTTPGDTAGVEYGLQVIRRVGAVGAGGFVVLASQLHPGAAYAAPAPSAQVQEAPPGPLVELAVPVGQAITVNSNSIPLLGQVVVDHAPHINVDISRVNYGPIQTLIAPNPDRAPATTPVVIPPANHKREHTTIALAGTLPVIDGKLFKSLVSPTKPVTVARDASQQETAASITPPTPKVGVLTDTAPVRRPANELHISAAGVDMVAGYEGWSSEVYIDPAGNPTIGYGHLINGPIPDEFRHGITEQRGRELLLQDLAVAEKAVDRAVKVPLTQGEEDALDDFAYNVGGGALVESTLLQVLNRGHYEEVPEQLARWDKADGVALPGLTRRRAEEAQVWTGSQPNIAAGQTNPANSAQQVQPAAGNPLGASLGNAFNRLAPPHFLNKIDNLVPAPTWKDGDLLVRPEALAARPYMRLPFHGPAIITSEFGSRESPTEGASTCHQGIDFALDTNDPILAPLEGEVVANAFLPANGNMLAIRHGDIVTWYSHLNERSPLAVGTKVQTGQVVGKAGSTGVSTGTHLHLAVQVGVDPKRDVSLLPDVNGHFVDPTGFLDGSYKIGNPYNTLRDASVCK